MVSFAQPFSPLSPFIISSVPPINQPTTPISVDPFTQLWVLRRFVAPAELISCQRFSILRAEQSCFHLQQSTERRSNVFPARISTFPREVNSIGSLYFSYLASGAPTFRLSADNFFHPIIYILFRPCSRRHTAWYAHTPLFVVFSVVFFFT